MEGLLDLVEDPLDYLTAEVRHGIRLIFIVGLVLCLIVLSCCCVAPKKKHGAESKEEKARAARERWGRAP